MTLPKEFSRADVSASVLRRESVDTGDKISMLLVCGSRKDGREIKSCLGNQQWEVVEADSAGKVLSRIAEHDLVAVFIDTRTPRMDAFETAERIRMVGKSRSLPIIFITAVPADGDFARKACSLGAVDFLVTPLVPDVVAAKVAVFADLYLKTAALERQGLFPSGNFGEALENIADPREAQAWLKRSEERYRRLFETAQDGILILEAGSGFITDVNPFLLRFLGYSREEMLGKQLWEIGLFRDIKANQQAFRTLKEKGFIRYEDLPLRTKSGSSRAVEFVSNTYRVGDEAVIQCNIRDITDRRVAEKALRVSEETLRQSKKLEAIGKLSGGIAHDFNNVLTAVNGYAGMALSIAEPKGTLHDFLAEILKAGERATALTRQLLDFSRQQILAPTILDLNAVISDLEVMLTRLIGESLKIRQDLDPELGGVRADLVQVQQLLMNLVINARDAMPGGGDITITTRNSCLDTEYAAKHPEAAPEDYVMFSVRDMGSGMDEDLKARIFDPFFTTKEIGKGTGMGLATVQGIVEKSGGHITVESSPGKGSIFRIYLPRTEKEDRIPAIPAVSDAAFDRGSETVLLVEDEEMVRSMVRAVLEMNGYKVLEAGSGTDALALCGVQANRMDLLLTDLRMPNVSGKELARQFSHMRPTCHVLFMSGYDEDSIAQHGLMEAGARFIQKPFSPAQLLKSVRDVLGRNPIKAA